jgi:hypothetical protein
MSLVQWAAYARAAYDVVFDPLEILAQARKPLPDSKLTKSRKRR